VGAGEAGDTVEQNHDVAPVFDQALGLFQNHVGNLDVPFGGLVEGGADHFSLDRTFHVGDFLRALIDQQHDQVDVLVVGHDRVGDFLEQNRLPGTRLRDDQPALPLADRREKVDQPR
jgi:hypothetical protein